MKTLNLDPGTTETAFIILENGSITDRCGRIPNGAMRMILLETPVDAIVCEEVRCYGMAVGIKTFDTCRWTGAYQEIARLTHTPFHFIGRKEVVTHWCGSARARPANVNQALRDHYGEKGTKNNPGPLYPIYNTGVKGASEHIMAALAVGGYWYAIKPQLDLLEKAFA
jgi:hypothetical protein